MRKILTSFAFIAASLTFAQVGVNNEDPQATLHIDAKEKTGVSTARDGILIPRVDRARAENMANVEESTLIYIDDENAGNKTGQAANIDEKGFYYFKGNVWVKLGGGAAAPTTAKAQTWREFRTAEVTDATANNNLGDGGVVTLTSGGSSIPSTAFFVIANINGNSDIKLPDATNITDGRMLTVYKGGTNGSLSVQDKDGKVGGAAGGQLVGDGTIRISFGKTFIVANKKWYPTTF